jgi:hypothetical protein
MIDISNYDKTALKLAKSGRAVKLLYNKEPLQVCTSSLYSPFGVKSINKDWSNFTEYSIDCSLNQASSETAINFRTFVEELDVIIKTLVKENVHMFSNKNETPNENFAYSSILRENGSYPKLMKLQLSRDKNGNFDSFIFDENKQKIRLDENNIETVLSKSKIFKCIIECSKLWYYNGKVGSIWNIVQLKFSEKTANTLSSNGNGNVYTQLAILD